MSLLIELVDVYGGGGLVAKSYLTLMTPWTVACQAPLSMRLPRQKYWSGFSRLPPGDLASPGIKFMPLTLQVVSGIAGGFFTAQPPGKPI